MNICVVSYDASGLRVGHSEADKSHRVVVDKLIERCDILCVQETFLAKQDLEGLNSIHRDFPVEWVNQQSSGVGSLGE